MRISKRYVTGCLFVFVIAACRYDFERTDTAAADAQGGDDGAAAAACVPSSFDLPSDHVLDARASGGLIAILNIDQPSLQFEILPISFDGTPRLPIVLNEGSYTGTTGIARLAVENGHVRTCGAHPSDGWGAAVLYDVLLSTGSLTSTQLCFTGVHCNDGCQVATHAPTPMTARVVDDPTNGNPPQTMVVATHDAQGAVLDQQVVADQGKVLGADYAGTALAIRTLDAGRIHIIAVDGAGARVTYTASVESSRLTRLGDQLYLLRGAGGYLDLLPVSADGTPGDPEFTVKTSVSHFTGEPTALRAGDTTWLAWSDGASAGLGAVSSAGAWREVAQWPQIQNAWVVGVTGGVTVVLDHGDHVTIQRMCP